MVSRISMLIRSGRFNLVGAYMRVPFSYRHALSVRHTDCTDGRMNDKGGKERTGRGSRGWGGKRSRLRQESGTVLLAIARVVVKAEEIESTTDSGGIRSEIVASLRCYLSLYARFLQRDLSFSFFFFINCWETKAKSREAKLHFFPGKKFVELIEGSESTTWRQSEPRRNCTNLLENSNTLLLYERRSRSV